MPGIGQFSRYQRGGESTPSHSCLALQLDLVDELSPLELRFSEFFDILAYLRLSLMSNVLGGAR